MSHDVTLSPSHVRQLLRLAAVIPLGIPVLLASWVLAARRFDWDVVESARGSAVTILLVLAVCILAPLFLDQPTAERRRGFVIFWFAVSAFFNLTWQIPLILLRDAITTAPHTHDNLAKFIAWWGYGFADSHYGNVSVWMRAEELWWLLAIAMSVHGLVLLRKKRDAEAFLLLGIAGALEAYNASLYMVYDAMAGFPNVPHSSTTSWILYWGFNPLWAGAALLASIFSFRFVMARLA